MENGGINYFDMYDPLSERGKAISIVSREEWGALPAKATEQLNHPANHVLVTYTDTISCYDREECIPVLKDLQAKHMVEGLPDIAPNFLISGDGTVYEGRGWQFKPHSASDRTSTTGDTLDIAYIGQFLGSHRPTLHATKVQGKLIDLGLESGYVHTLYNLHEPNLDKSMFEDSSDSEDVRDGLRYNPVM